MSARTFTVVSFHAHPDDEALLTRARWPAPRPRGTASCWWWPPRRGRARRRRPRRRRCSAAGARRAGRVGRAIGAARVVFLGYPDSGSISASASATGESPSPSSTRASSPRELAAVLREEARRRAHDLRRRRRLRPPRPRPGAPGRAPRGRAGRHAGRAGGDRRPRPAAAGDAAAAGRVALRDPTAAPARPARTAFTPRAELTHRVDVRPHLDRQAGARCRPHASQADGERRRAHPRPAAAAAATAAAPRARHRVVPRGRPRAGGPARSTTSSRRLRGSRRRP